MDEATDDPIVDAGGRPDEPAPALIGLRAWRGKEWVPAPVDHEREERFLDQYTVHGWYVPVAAATALREAAARTDSNTRHLLYLRLFGEYVNALEVLGGWAWAVRHRREFKLLLDAFLGYLPGDPQTFYALVADDGDADLAALLDLPPLGKVAVAWADRGTEQALSVDELLDEFARCTQNLRQAAAQYFDPKQREQLLVTNYNKTKHGAPIIRTPSLREDEFFVLAAQRDPTEPGRYLFSKFRADDTMFDRVAANVEFVANTTRALVSLVRNLKVLELL